MASNYNSLGFNLMTTGENAGTWGTNTNLNLNYLRDTFGYISIAMTADRTLTIPDNSTGTYDGRAFIIELTGTLGGTRVLDIAATAGSGSSPGGSASILKPFIVFDNTTHSGDTLTFKVTSANGFLLCEGNNYICHSDGTNMVEDLETRNWRTITASETVQSGAQLFVDTDGGAVTVTLPASPTNGDIVNFVDSRYTFDSNALTIGRNSSKIANTSADLVVNTEGAAFGLVYSGSDVGWTYTEK